MIEVGMLGWSIELGREDGEGVVVPLAYMMVESGMLATLSSGK
jgi:hypothetical protein